ncbi:unnamed protein product, partial [Oikopleura dioica]
AQKLIQTAKSSLVVDTTNRRDTSSSPQLLLQRIQSA